MIQIRTTEGVVLRAEDKDGLLTLTRTGKKVHLHSRDYNGTMCGEKSHFDIIQRVVKKGQFCKFCIYLNDLER